jgi:hypothetical protein
MPTDSGWKRNSLLPNKLLGMRRMLLAAGLVAAMSWTGAWMTAGAVGGETAATPARIIDRTLLCSTLLQAGAREITVYATAAVPGQKEPGGSVTDPSSLKQKLPEVSLSTGSFDPTGGLARITAGGRVGRAPRTFSIDREHCSPSRTRIPLSARGLDGGAASPFGDSYECFPPRRILVRARAIFRSPTLLRQSSEGFWTPTPVNRGYLAARTPSGKPLVFAEVRESGAARLFVAPGCISE